MHLQIQTHRFFKRHLIGTLEKSISPEFPIRIVFVPQWEKQIFVLQSISLICHSLQKTTPEVFKWPKKRPPIVERGQHPEDSETRCEYHQSVPICGRFGRRVLQRNHKTFVSLALPCGFEKLDKHYYNDSAESKDRQGFKGNPPSNAWC